ncbi:hypothetical protein FACS1894199_08660 [Bacteroidia bacterium]|nr:hypothetical protein FACS1894199_08660 [Bacteroidia bacterium]
MIEMKRVILFFCLLIPFACKQVNELSDKAEITKFEVLSYTPTNAKIGGAVIEQNTIYIIDSTTLFPLQLIVKIGTNSTTADVLGLPDTLKFKDQHQSFDFYLIAESGVPHAYKIKLRPADSGAEISNFTLNANESLNTSVDIDYWNSIVAISRHNATFPLTIHPSVTISAGATFKGSDLTELTFASKTDVTVTTVVSSQGNEKRWRIYVADNSQLPNSKFELWTDEKNIDPFPGKGMGWASANNSVVQGTVRTSHNGGYAAQMKTDIQNIPLLGHQLITAASLYTGSFKLGFDFEHPRLMTNFGIPHKIRIEAIKFDAQYLPGPQLMQAFKKPEAGNKYVAENISGADTGQVWVELLHWSGEGELIYHGYPMDGLKVLGRAEYIMDGVANDHQNWQSITLPCIYKPEYEGIAPTHIVVCFSSSIAGDFFRGAPGSVLNVDNVELIY